MMKRRGKANRWIIALTVVILSATYNAMAETDCNTTLTGKVNDSVRVSLGDICILNGATVNGRIDVFGGELQSSSSTINGTLNLFVIESGVVNKICGTTITASVETILGEEESQTYFGSLDGQCAGDVITGHVLFDRNAGTVELVDSSVGGQVTFHFNTGTSVVGGNTINGVLHCALNTNISNGGLKNTVNNDVNSLQCAGF